MGSKHRRSSKFRGSATGDITGRDDTGGQDREGDGGQEYPLLGIREKQYRKRPWMGASVKGPWPIDIGSQGDQLRSDPDDPVCRWKDLIVTDGRLITHREGN